MLRLQQQQLFLLPLLLPLSAASPGPSLGSPAGSGTSEAAASLRTDDELPTWAMPVPDKGRPRAGLSPSPQTRRSA